PTTFSSPTPQHPTPPRSSTSQPNTRWSPLTITGSPPKAANPSSPTSTFPTRCGCCTLPEPPAPQRALCTVTVAWCWKPQNLLDFITGYPRGQPYLFPLQPPGCCGICWWPYYSPVPKQSLIPVLCLLGDRDVNFISWTKNRSHSTAVGQPY